VIRALRFLGGYLRPDSCPVREEEVRVPLAGGEVEATLYLPNRRSRAPGWVVLHGLTVPGRRHESLIRFVRALSATGAAVLVPDVPAWRALEVHSATARETLVGAVDYLEGRPEVLPGGPGVVGFSFGATHALIAAAHPELRDRIRKVAGFGGYADLRRVTRCMVTGEHEWAGVRYRLDPDPYGGWILASNFLTRVPGMEGMGRVADAAREIAMEAGRRRTYAAEAVYDAMKAELRERMDAAEREVWDVIAPPSGQAVAAPAPRRAAELAEALGEAALAADPALDPSPALPHLRARVVLSHGEADRLVPFTETLRLAAALPPHVDASVTITRLFAHSTGSAGVRALEYGREGVRFVRLLHRALRAG
jgi:pimeloyl-ACP methyl ester carboxylesterase